MKKSSIYPIKTFGSKPSFLATYWRIRQHGRSCSSCPCCRCPCCCCCSYWGTYHRLNTNKITLISTPNVSNKTNYFHLNFWKRPPNPLLMPSLPVLMLSLSSSLMPISSRFLKRSVTWSLEWTLWRYETAILPILILAPSLLPSISHYLPNLIIPNKLYHTTSCL